MDLAEFDLKPLYPTGASLTQQLSSKVLSIDQRRSLVNHSLARACLFADLALLAFLFNNKLSNELLDLLSRDEDGLNLISQTIMGFGDDPDRTVDREECIRMLIAHGAKADEPDLLGWTPLHHAAMRAPASLVVHLLAHGASSLAKTHRSFTPLDLISAYEAVPNRQDVALILRESMREQGWTGSALELRRGERQKRADTRNSQKKKSVAEWTRIGTVLGSSAGWWNDVPNDTSDDPLDDPSENEYGVAEDVPDELVDEEYLSPPNNHISILVFAPHSIPHIIQRVVADAKPALYPISVRSAPANTLYFLARFACIHCDDSWLDALLGSALDCIEQITYARPDGREDLPHTAFWLYNTTLLLHLLRCDHSMNDVCENLDIFFLLEELIRSLYAFILRCFEKRIQPLIITGLLDHASLTAEFESIQFESDWSFFRSLAPKRKNASVSVSASSSNLSTVSDGFASNGRNTPLRPPSPSPSSKTFSSIRQTMKGNGHTPLSAVFSNVNGNGTPNGTSNPSAPPAPSPSSLTAQLSSLHALLRLYSINPSIIIQAFSQIYYWVACETFNKMIVQKKYLCRSRAMEIGMNVSVLEEWVTSVGLPASVSSHFQTLRELLIWLQCHSSIDQFTSLIDTIQTMKLLNPVQMRRAVRDYRYEVNEPRMDEECQQYLGQLQKDWERRRVRMGVEALQKEHAEKSRDRAESVASSMMSADYSSSFEYQTPPPDYAPDEPELSDKVLAEQQSAIDRLFDRDHLKNEWIAPGGPTVLGELMDTSFPLRLILPSDPVLLGAWPGPGVDELIEREARERKRASQELSLSNGYLSDGRSSDSGATSMGTHSRSASRASAGNRGAMEWRLRLRTVREVSAQVLHTLDGGFFRRPTHELFGAHLDADADVEDGSSASGSDGEEDGEHTQVLSQPTVAGLGAPSTFTKRPKRFSRIPRESSGAETIVPSTLRAKERESSRTPEPQRVPRVDEFGVFTA